MNKIVLIDDDYRRFGLQPVSELTKRYIDADHSKVGFRRTGRTTNMLLRFLKHWEMHPEDQDLPIVVRSLSYRYSNQIVIQLFDMVKKGMVRPAPQYSQIIIQPHSERIRGMDRYLSIMDHTFWEIT
jgi:hypothetical protein